MPHKYEPGKNQNDEIETPKKDNNVADAAPVLNPFEKGHGELSPEALDNLEQFKDAQMERD